MFPKKKLFLLFLSVRTLMALLSVSFYVPDETWQSVEIAHGLVWPGKSYKTWEWDHGLRSYLHPVLFVPVFELLKLLKIDSVYLVSTCPRLLQGVLSAFADVCFVAFFDRVFAKRPSDTKWFVFTYLTNWCLLYSGSRTLVNQLELILTGAALSMFDFIEGSKTGYIAIIVVSFVIRPTTAIFWLPLVLYHLGTILKSGLKNFVVAAAADLAPPVLAALATCVAIDSWLYGRLTIVPWNFLKFNLLMDVSSQYGTNPAHWYLTNALPTILLGPLGLVPLAGGLVLSWKEEKTHPKILSLALVWSLLVYSCLGHKEHRFILPLVPLCICYIAFFVSKVLSKNKSYQKLFIFVTLVTNLPLTAYLSLVHQTGPDKVVQHLANEFESSLAPGKILFLMPCHSTPFFSHFHLANVDLRFLECPPRLTREDEATLDEADSFYQNPREKFEEMLEEFSATRIVMFDSMTDELKDQLVSKRFELCQDFFHSHVSEGRVGSRVHVHCRAVDEREA